MEALRDCETAIDLDPPSMKAHYRRAQALAACKLYKAGRAGPLPALCLLSLRRLPSLQAGWGTSTCVYSSSQREGGF